MPQITTDDGVRLYYEETGSGTPIVFVHEFADDYRGFEPQIRYLARRYRCIAYNARGYPPSEVPEDPDRYSQDRARDDIRAVLDGLEIATAHVVGLSMGGFATLHFGLTYPDRALSLVVAGCGYGAEPGKRQQFHDETAKTAALIENAGMKVASEAYAIGPSRVQFQNKDPRGWAEFAAHLAEHSTAGSARTMRGVQARRPSLWDLTDRMRNLKVPTLIMTGDEDDPCLEPGLLMKRTIPTAALVVLPNTGHAVNLEEPELFNRSCAEFSHQVESGRWPRRDPPPAMLAECEALLAGQVSPEFLRSQIEVGTRVCTSLDEARADLRRLRATVAGVAARHGLAPVAAATHPFARWGAQKTTDRHRYAILRDDLQGVGQRLAICGLHVHIGIPEDELRIDLLNQASYFLPHLLALSTSSPFWQGENTGLKSYRLAVFDELPRTGTPERFASWGEYRRHVDILVGAGLIENATNLWWDLRPSARFPTLEMRITDSCTTLEDSLAIAALFRCLLRMLWRLKRDNQRWRIYARMLIDENRWRAQRYGTDQGLVDFGRGAIFPYAELLDEMLALVDQDARHFGCLPELVHTREILARGTSAHSQLAVFERALGDGATHAEALAAVVDWLIAETVRGL